MSPDPVPPLRARGVQLVISCRHCRGEVAADALDVAVSPECGCLCHQLAEELERLEKNR